MPIRLILLLLLACAQLCAQSWDSLRQLKPGERLRVIEKSGEERSGEFAAVTADTLSLRTSKGTETVSRTNVRLVQSRNGSRRLRNLAIGIAVGVVIGVAVDQTAGAYLRNETGESGGVRTATYAGPIALCGGIGAAVPAFRTVYRAK